MSETKWNVAKKNYVSLVIDGNGKLSHGKLLFQFDAETEPETTCLF